MPPRCHACEEKKLIYHVTVLIWAENAQRIPPLPCFCTTRSEVLPNVVLRCVIILPKLIPLKPLKYLPQASRVQKKAKGYAQATWHGRKFIRNVVVC